MKRKGQLSVHSENILPIIKKWLYSEKEIFLRELVSNAADAISKFLILTKQGLAAEKEKPRIDIRIDTKNRTLVIEDNGLGMTETEVESYITQIAFSGAKDFLEKYETSDGIIGQFGLGFFSAFMAAKRVDIETLSYQKDATGVFWSSEGESSYTIAPQKNLTKVGTKITLHIADDSEDFLSEEKIHELLRKYCLFFPYSIFVNDKPFAIQDPLYLKAAKECKKEDYEQFYQQLYPFEESPVLTVHLNVEVPFHLKGILYFPKQSKTFEERKGKIQLFCNRIFVSEDCKEILPDYLLMLRGVLDSPDIPLNVSRSHLQNNPQVKALGSHIAKKVLDRLELLQKEDFLHFEKIFEDLEITLKLGILQDEKFAERAKHLLIWKNSLEKSSRLSDFTSKEEKKIFYTQKEHTLLTLFKEKNIPVIFSTSPIDSMIFSYLEKKDKITFQRIDAALETELLDVSKEKDLLDAAGKSERVRIEEFIQESLQNEKEVKVQVKSLASQKIPGWFLFEEKERRFQEYLSLTSAEEKLPLAKIFVVNSNYPLIEKAFKLKEKEPLLAQKIVQHIYGLTQLSENELFVKNSLELLKELLEKNAALL